MESTQSYTMIEITDIRQSGSWAKYLESVGWKTRRTSSGVLIDIKKLWLFGSFSLIKIQKPRALTDKDLEEIDEICREERYFLVKLEPYIGQDEVLLTKWKYRKSGTPLSTPSTMYLNLTLSEEELWANISHSGKYSIKRAERELTGIKFYENPSVEILKKFYPIFKATAVKQKFYMIPESDYLARISSFGREAFLIAAYDKNNELMGAKTYLGNGEMVLYSLGATTEHGREVKAGYELLWKSMLYFKSRGYKVLDLEGVSDSRFTFFTKTWQGFTDFKDKFGGEVVRFPTPYVKFANPVLRFLNRFSLIPF
jgi:lipid II:glycine glycyltransferase (peptidoglycan interpeptide bridge formation enzyme)